MGHQKFDFDLSPNQGVQFVKVISGVQISELPIFEEQYLKLPANVATDATIKSILPL